MSIRSVIPLFFVFILTLTLSGCASPSKKSAGISKTAVTNIVDGQTTKSEILLALGSPESITVDAKGDELFVYSDTENQALEKMLKGGAIGGGVGFSTGMVIGVALAPVTFGWSLLWAPAVGMATGVAVGGTIGHSVGAKKIVVNSRLLVSLDDNDIVREHYHAFELSEHKIGDSPKTPQKSSRRPNSLSGKVDIDLVRIDETQPRNPHNLALIIGIEKYKRLPTAPYAEKDGFLTRLYAIANLDIPSDNILLLLGRDATLAEITKALEPDGGWLAKRVKRNVSRVFVYYAGHGLPSPDKKQDLYLLPFDSDPDFTSTLYPVRLMMNNLSKLGAKELILAFDTCFSGEASGGRGKALLKGARPIFRVSDQPPAGAKNATIFYASTGNQVSNAYPDVKHGLFSYYFLKGLGGDADKNIDGQVTAGEVWDYLNLRVPIQAGRLNKKQTPLVTGLDRNLIISKIPASVSK